MLSHTLEFLRISDTLPNDEKVRRRRESAEEIVAHIRKTEHHKNLLALVQGIVNGFQPPVFSQSSPIVELLIKSVQKRDATLPNDLTENALEIRALAGIAIGELLGIHGDTTSAMLAALSLRSALDSRPTATEKYLKWMLDFLLQAADALTAARAKARRRRETPALEKLGQLEEPVGGEADEAWSILRFSVYDALKEAKEQEKINQEETEVLWWMFAAYSDVAQNHMSDIESPVVAAFCCGLELAQRSILPPPASARGMIKRAVEAGRKPNTLGTISLNDAAEKWITPDALILALCPPSPQSDEAIASYPAIFPVSWVCRQLRESRDVNMLGKEVFLQTGIPLSHKQVPARWGAQVFAEAILQRALKANKEE